MSTVSGASLFMGNNATETGSARVPVSTLGQDDFLKLLVTKMSSQDPMNPQGDEEFISQMAQFTALEQSKIMRNDIAALSANGMIGRTVTIKGQSTQTGSDPDVTGTVSSISFKNGSPELVVGGRSYALNRVTNITPYVDPLTPTQFNPTSENTPGLSPLPLPALNNLQAQLESLAQS